MQKRSVLVSSSAVLKPPQNTTPPRNPPRVRNPRLKCTAGRLTSSHRRPSRRFSPFKALSVAAGRCHVGDGVAHEQPGLGLRLVPLQAEIAARPNVGQHIKDHVHTSDEQTAESHSLMRISYADFCLKKK